MADFDFARSVSQRRTYRTCPRRWYHQYGQGLRSRAKPAYFAFGDATEHVAHGIVAGWLATPDQAEACFEALWAPWQNQPPTVIAWPKSKSWTWYRERGKGLARLAAVELPKRIRPQSVQLVNQPFRFAIEGVRELSIPDSLTHVQRGRVVEGVLRWDDELVLSIVDYKSGGYAYHPLAAELDEQLSDYQLAAEAHGFQIEQLILCVWVTTAQPQIQWLVAPPRTRDDLAEHVSGALATNAQILAGVFPRNEQSCLKMGECWAIPACFKSQAYRREAELVQDPAKARDERELALEWE